MTKKLASNLPAKRVVYFIDFSAHELQSVEFFLPIDYLFFTLTFYSYFATGQLMLNGFLQSQGFPKKTHFDIQKPSETISNLINHAVKTNLMVDIDSTPYVKPSVSYIKDVLKLGKNREFLQKMNTTDVSNKLTDTLNLEVRFKEFWLEFNFNLSQNFHFQVIEPILKVHRAYKFAINEPECDQYVLCEINSHNPNEKLGLGGFKSGVLKFGSYAASWFISEKTHTSFWTLFGSVNDPQDCHLKYPADCERFVDQEQKVTTEYPHTEL
jgi:hypothetical protein